MAGRLSVAWLTAIDGVPAKMLRSKSAVCGVRGRDVARLSVAGLGRQGRGRLWLCLGAGAVEGAFCSAWMRLKAAIFAMFLTPFCLDMGSWWVCTCLVKVVAWTKLQYDSQ